MLVQIKQRKIRNFILVQNNIRKTYKKSLIKENPTLVQTKQRKILYQFKII